MMLSSGVFTVQRVVSHVSPPLEVYPTSPAEPENAMLSASATWIDLILASNDWAAHLNVRAAIMHINKKCVRFLTLKRIIKMPGLVMALIYDVRTD